MNQRFRLMTVVGTRPEIIRLSEVIKRCDVHFDHVFVHTGQNWSASLNDIFFADLDLRKPDYDLAAVGESLGATMGNIIAKTYDLMAQVKPDALLILGDTNSALCAISAKRLKIPIFHMEAGNRCFDENVPEEINRRIVDHISDVNLSYTEHSRRYLHNEGIKPDRVFVTGSPMAEVLERHRAKIAESQILDLLNLKPKKYFVVSIHREENIDQEENYQALMSTLNGLAERYDIPLIVTTHPRTQKKLRQAGTKLDGRIQLLEPFGFTDYIKLQMHSFCVLSDSGTLSEESSMLGFSGVLLRTSTERPEVLDEGSILFGSLDLNSVQQNVEIAVALEPSERTGLVSPINYRSTEVSTKVVKIISSMTELIRSKVWNINRTGFK